MERRRHHRVPLALPIRLRWPGPFGQAAEVRQTLDVSRGGALVESHHPHAPGAALWVTFPFEPALPDSPFESPARVVRVASDESGTRLAIEFETARRLAAAAGKGPHQENEHRSAPRRILSIPVRVRLNGLLWHEEAMTLDMSTDGLSFLSTCLYEPGNRVYVSLMNRSWASPWTAAREVPAVVTRVEPLVESHQVRVALCRRL
jgi:hypothetical protein